jgi:mono/diheme cytochrome c family protein
MSSSIVITIVILAAIAWVSYLAVSALRSRGSEEVAANLAPGTTDDELETKRLEGIQLSAVVLSGILAVSIPVYYLTENNRQEGFVEEFSETAIEHGHEWYLEFQCGSCHGADGGGGAASYVEKRTGVTVTWEAPSINDVFYRYDREEVKYWLIYGRGNSPMPAWGLEGGGPMNDAQIEELLDYMQSEEFQIEQEAVLAETEPEIAGELARLDGAQAAIEGALLDQQQLIADILRANDIKDELTRIAAEAADVLDGASEGIDTDGDGLSDTAEADIVALKIQARELVLIDPLSLNLTFQADDANTNGIPDAEAAQDFLDTLRTLADNPLDDDVQSAPILGPIADAVEAILAGVADDDGTDDDGDGLTNTQEQQLAGQAANVVSTLVDSKLTTVALDPTMEETTIGVPDLQSAREAVAAINTVALNARVTDENVDRILPPARVSLDNLVDAAINQRWEFDFEGIAANNDISVEEAQRVVGIYNGYCARCHTSGYSAGLAFTQEAGSGGFGPAVWQARPAVQFLSDEDLRDFLIVGAVANQPYGVNGFGNGQMPAFGAILSQEDLTLLAKWLRNGDLRGVGVNGDGLEAGAQP